MESMTLTQALILGIVEGITEYLPVSSTGHLILASSLMGLDRTPEQKAALDTFNIVIQGGAILAVLGLYFPRVVQMCKGLLGKDRDGLALAIRIFVAFLPAAFLGVLLKEHIERLLFNAPTVLTALALGGVFMIVLDRAKIRKFRQMDGDEAERFGPDLPQIRMSQAVLIGFLQCVAMIPGTSRSMMTIAGGVLVGLHPRRAAEFSFLLGLPTLGGACVYSLYKDISNDGPNMFEIIGWAPIAVGMISTTICAALAVRWLVNFLNKHGLAPFGYYRLALAAVLGTLIYTGVVVLHAPDDINPMPGVVQIDADGPAAVETDEG
ncbi:MAG: undecaprenyl-diphosphate phosphatase [Phycisphaerales bacterium]|nr:undecaprenyl-diphosphate phosphatase [Phycisphaerales bacterium]